MTETAGPPEPRANPDLFGHEAAETAFIDALRADRLAHAWLVTGPKGVGKASFAFRAARFLLADGMGAALPGLGPETLAVEREHPVFARVAAASHTDLLTVERSFDERRKKMRDEIVVEDARSLGAFMRLTPGEGAWRVAIIDSADEMNRHAANAVLKVLEEPPRQAVILLVSHTPGRLLPTIRSRCRKLALRPLDDALVAQLLVRHHPELDDRERLALARLAEGSPGRALGLAAGGGLALFDALMGLLASLPRTDAKALHALFDRVSRADARDAYEMLFALLRWWIARLVRGAASGVAPSDIIAGEGAVRDRLAAAAGLDRWTQLWEKINRLTGRADALNLDRKQVLLTAFNELEIVARSQHLIPSRSYAP